MNQFAWFSLLWHNLTCCQPKFSKSQSSPLNKKCFGVNTDIKLRRFSMRRVTKKIKRSFLIAYEVFYLFVHPLLLLHTFFDEKFNICYTKSTPRGKGWEVFCFVGFCRAGKNNIYVYRMIRAKNLCSERGNSLRFT